MTSNYQEKTNLASILHNSLFLFICLSFTLLSCNDSYKNPEFVENLQNPRVADVYYLKTERKTYTILKIAAISEDSIAFFKNYGDYDPSQFVDESINKIKFERVDLLDQSKFWTDSILTLSNNKIIQMVDEELIYNIKR